MDTVEVDDFPRLRAAVLDLMGLDLSAYKSRQLERRLVAFISRSGANSTAEFTRLLGSDPALQTRFQDYMTINVSEFFRDPDRFDYLFRAVLPALIARRRRLRVWSAGCSHGAEIYTVAILLDALGADSAELIATDIDRNILVRATQGQYGERDVRSVPGEYLARYFQRTAGDYEVVSHIRRRVRFSHHNLLADPHFPDLDLILCRNVVIYFTREAKDGVFRQFYQALAPGGYLFTGGTETMFDSRTIGFAIQAPCFYHKPASG